MRKIETTWMVIAAALAGCGSSGGSKGPAASTAPVPSSAVIGELLQGRSEPAVALVGTSSVLVAGGATDSEPSTATVELIDAETGLSEAIVDPMSRPRVHARAVALGDGRIIIIGGSDGTRALDTTEVFDPLTRSFSPGPSLTASRSGPAIAVVDSRTIIVAGGAGQTSVDAIDMATLSVARVKAKLVHDHLDARAIVMGRRLVIGGGGDSIEVVDLDTGKTSLPARHDGARFFESIVVHAGVVFIAGGDTGAGVTNETHELSGTLDLVRDVYPCGSPRADGFAFELGGAVVLAGGRNRHGALLTTDVIASTATVASTTISSVPGPSLHDAHLGGEFVTLGDGRVVIVGGGDANHRSTSIEMLIPPGGRPAPDRFASTRDREVDERKKLRDAEDLAAKNAAERDAEIQLRQQLEAQLASVQATLASAQAALATMTAAKQQAEAERDAARAQVAALQAQGSRDQAQIQSLTQRAQDAEGRLASANGTITTLQGQVSSLQAQVTDLQNKLAAANAAASAPKQVATSATTTAFFAPTGGSPIKTIEPQGGSPGQDIRIYFGATPLPADTKVYFSKIEAKVVTRDKLWTGGDWTYYFVVTIPPNAPAQSLVQIASTGQMSAPVSYTVKP